MSNSIKVEDVAEEFKERNSLPNKADVGELQYGVAIDKLSNQVSWLRTTLTSLVQQSKEEERERIIKILRGSANVFRYKGYVDYASSIDTITDSLFNTPT